MLSLSCRQYSQHITLLCHRSKWWSQLHCLAGLHIEVEIATTTKIIMFSLCVISQHHDRPVLLECKAKQNVIFATKHDMGPLEFTLSVEQLICIPYLSRIYFRHHPTAIIVVLLYVQVYTLTV